MEQTTEVARGTHIQFHVTPKDPKRKTAIWIVANGDYILGLVKWFPRWRKFCFFPREDEPTVYEETCLRDIASFMETRTKWYKAKSK